jgi:uncharacterized lipoprotein YddW (UPF0748 family)
MRLLILILLYLIPLFSFGKAIHQERSALWVVRYALGTKTDVDKVISTANDLNISDIFVQVRARGEAFYDSRFESVSTVIKEPFDPLQYMIDQAGKTGVRVHAWVNMFFIWSGNDMPKDPEHLVNYRSEYILRNDGFPDYQSLRAQGCEGFFLDPRIPQIQLDLLNILQEIAERYNISGIHLDYFRYPGLTFSFTPASRTLFMMEYLYDPWLIYNSANQYSNERGYEVFLHADNEYRESLITTITLYLQTITHTIKEINPDLEISIAVKPDPVQAKYRFFQDWLTWLQKKLCDFVVIMNYRTNYEEFDLILRQLQDRQVPPVILVGISTYNQDETAVIRRLRAVKSSEFAGYALFSYNHLSEHKNYLNSIRKELNGRKSNGY